MQVWPMYAAMAYMIVAYPGIIDLERWANRHRPRPGAAQLSLVMEREAKPEGRVVADGRRQCEADRRYTRLKSYAKIRHS